jgi:hypothetical protein
MSYKISIKTDGNFLLLIAVSLRTLQMLRYKLER